jgi:gluconokinase
VSNELNAHNAFAVRLPLAVIVMGVTGSGKSTVGARLAALKHWDFYDGDDYHPASNIEKMRRGEPLTDEDRAPWLDRLRELIEEKLAAGQSAVVACSALRSVYRKRLLPHDRRLADRVRFVYLRISPEAAKERLLMRKDHFMPAPLVVSQFEALEEPEDALTIDAERPVDEVLARAADSLSLPPQGQNMSLQEIRGHIS